MCLNRNYFSVDEKIIGYIGILLGFDFIIAYIAGTAPNTSAPIAIITLLFSIALVISSVVLVFGVINKSRNFLIPYLVVIACKLVLLTVVFILNLVAGAIIFIVIFVLNAAFWTYCGLCILSMYRRLGNPQHALGVV